jgi:hypothetical protein
LCQRLEKEGIIEPSVSTWLNPVVLVRKKDVNLRIIADLRRLNDLVRLDAYELPKIQELLVKIRDMKYFSVIDLKDGFFQIPIHPLDREKTTFAVNGNLKQFKRMPQGFKNSPAIF